MNSDRDKTKLIEKMAQEILKKEKANEIRNEQFDNKKMVYDEKEIIEKEVEIYENEINENQ